MLMKIAAALTIALAGAAHAAPETAIVAGGCFWCVESDFESVKGVSEVVSGYAGGKSDNPTYQDHEGHLEVVQIQFDNSVISYGDLMAKFLRSIDVTDDGGQFCDRGNAYRSAIFATPEQTEAAKAAVAAASAELGAPVVTPVRQAAKFWVAEDYHQDYYKGTNIVLTRGGPKKQSNAYKFYREGCGRDARVREVWGNAAFVGH